MITYHIETPSSSHVRHKIDAAQFLLEDLVYEELKNNGGLDTRWGEFAMAQAIHMNWDKGGTINLPYGIIICTCSIS